MLRKFTQTLWVLAASSVGGVMIVLLGGLFTLLCLIEPAVFAIPVLVVLIAIRLYFACNASNVYDRSMLSQTRFQGDTDETRR